MAESTFEEGILAALLQEFETHTLPRALDIKEKVYAGEPLLESDIELLEETLAEATRAKPRVDRHPELQDLFAHAVSLYHEITAKALENETRS